MKKCGLNPTQLEDTAAQHAIWQQLCHQGVQRLEEDQSGGGEAETANLESERRETTPASSGQRGMRRQ
ncbi:hypothetical protein SKAU_G00127760 [Synaphobranchus kaupii]|uniref:Uncharacterized protein n=1 Tax=Synaphobranchus kaupii TaxID=118154 RepID=A0A9Q1FQG7_SYNKA|nr:hypothetical protein SKAU_G00127760 [Synaphobranchus kaupii]